MKHLNNLKTLANNQKIQLSKKIKAQLIQITTLISFVAQVYFAGIYDTTIFIPIS